MIKKDGLINFKEFYKKLYAAPHLFVYYAPLILSNLSFFFKLTT